MTVFPIKFKSLFQNLQSRTGCSLCMCAVVMHQLSSGGGDAGTQLSWVEGGVGIEVCPGRAICLESHDFL